MKYGYIYKLSYKGLDYYGSSVNKYRFLEHKSHYKQWKDGKRGYTSSFNLFELAEANNELPTFEVLGCFYKYFCNECIRKEEQKYIDMYPCINKCNAFGLDEKKRKEQAFIFRKKYYEEHKEYEKEYQKEYAKEHKKQRKVYAEKNRDKIAEYQRQYRLLKKHSTF